MIYIAIAVIIFVVDFFIKNYIELNRKEGITEKILGGAILIRKHHNRGFMMNKGSNRQTFVAVVSLVLAVCCTCMFAITLGKSGKNLLNTGLALLLGGAYSNTYDRLKRKYVVDYFSFGVPINSIRRIIFNISDICIMLGALFIVITSCK